MKVFVTGGSGYIGHKVVSALLSKGYRVVTLVRSERASIIASAQGAIPHYGDLIFPSSWVGEAREADAIVHCAHDISDHMAELDKIFRDTILDINAERQKPRVLLYLSGTMFLGSSPEIIYEYTYPKGSASTFTPWRFQAETELLNVTGQDLRVVIIRPGYVYGGLGGWLHFFFYDAALRHKLRIMGDGENYWSVIHRADLANLTAHLLHSNAQGIFHAVDGTPVTVKDIAVCVAQTFNLATSDIESINFNEGREAFGRLAHGFTLSQKVMSSRGDHVPGWIQHPDVLNNIRSESRLWLQQLL